MRRRPEIAPIRVRWSQDHVKWIIIAGERRYRAVKLAALEEISCIFVEDELSENEVKKKIEKKGVEAIGSLEVLPKDEKA